MSKKTLKKILIYFTVLLSFALLLVIGFFFKDIIVKKQSNADGLISQKEAKNLAQVVGRLILLPTDEIPTIATVSDPNLLKNQSFFIESKKGDKVLIFTNAKKAILYRPEIDKIITVAPLSIGGEENILPESNAELSNNQNKGLLESSF